MTSKGSPDGAGGEAWSGARQRTALLLFATAFSLMAWAGAVLVLLRIA
ncbi:MAG: hypothetical protein JOZ27_08660 [Caulobacteraceae bacterium]|nr:hypothetical protein [Caulobacteraceae bacterium]